MNAAPAPSYSTWDELVQTWQHLDLPDKAWRAEIVEETIVMSPPPGYPYNAIAARVQRALDRAIPDEWGVFQTAGVAIPLRRCLFVPDIAVIPFGELPSDDTPGPVPVERALLVAEITSKGNADVDRKEKLWAYGQAEVPLYSLIDRFAADGPAVFLHSEPHEGSYRMRERFPFGKPVELPAPFDLTIPTDEF
ncbi:Uma2 family endonuclease [Saccharopolyspora endophytica]|uniref:Uma2 family endonuclease n=1 Tax=Saccharopolyspora endophytica TaxID=543886 RepID=A0ABS5DNT7_9PSEU|nr:Uma2 family endonuclease [Saccharopolyspora endophytica]MBQ0927964.1 Uma2 family endonuclease [Saccharopolyspora endophytica]